MKEPQILKVALLCIGLWSLPMAHAAMMNKADYNAGKSRINAAYKMDKAACGAMSGNAKDICMEEAKAKEKVARAELEYEYSGKASDRRKLMEVKAKTTYAVAKERCDDMEGNAKDVCVKEAKAVETKALADAKMSKEVDEAKKDAAKEKADADYKVELERCDAMMGDAKTNCIAAAKARFGRY